MAKKVLFRVDTLSEMLEVHIDGKCVNEGNFWDFDFVQDVPDLLYTLGIDISVEDYEYGDDFEEEDEE